MNVVVNGFNISLLNNMLYVYLLLVEVFITLPTICATSVKVVVVALYCEYELMNGCRRIHLNIPIHYITTLIQTYSDNTYNILVALWLAMTIPIPKPYCDKG